MFEARLIRPHFKAAIFASYLRLLESDFPHINIRSLCQKAGLTLEYVRDENHWVSVTFERRFTSLILEETGDSEVPFKAGRLGISRPGLGEGLYFLVANVIPLDTIYSSLPKLTSLLNKVMAVEVVESTPGHFKFLFKPILNELNQEEAEALVSNMPTVMENVKGYYGQIPTAKKLPPARTNVTLVDVAKGIYALEVNYFAGARMVERIIRLLPFPAFCGVSLLLHSHWHFSLFWSALYSYAAVASVVNAYLLFQNKNLRVVSNQFEDSLYKLDTQNKDLYDAKNKLQRKLEESQAINELVSHLIKATMEEEALQLGCECLVDNLHYDRAFILLFDPATNSLKLSASKGLTLELQKGMQGLNLPPEIGDTDPAKFTNVFKLRRSLLVKDVHEHIAKLSDPTSLTMLQASGTRSFVAAPIFTHTKSLGILVADCVSKQKIMTEDDLRLISTAGQQIGIAIEQQRGKQELIASYHKQVELSESYSRFVPFETLKILDYKSIFDVKIGDYVDANVTIMFSDIRGFTTLCETMTPSEILSFLNSYYSRLSPIIKSNQGTIDKFMGDGIMVIFPKPENALAAAVDIQRAIYRYNLEQRVGARIPIHAGVGVATGRVVFGPLGSDKRLELTAIADAVNVASRLDSLCRESGQSILVTGISEEALGHFPHLVFDRLEAVKVKGRSNEVSVIAVGDPQLGESFLPNVMTEAQSRYVEAERNKWRGRQKSIKAS